MRWNAHVLFTEMGTVQLFIFSYKGIKPLEMERLDQFNTGFKSIKIGTSWNKTFLYKVWDRT